MDLTIGYLNLNYTNLYYHDSNSNNTYNITDTKHNVGKWDRKKFND